MTQDVIGKIKCRGTFRKSSVLVSALLITLSSWAQKIATLTLKEKAETAWQYFAKPLVVTVIKE